MVLRFKRSWLSHKAPRPLQAKTQEKTVSEVYLAPFFCGDIRNGLSSAVVSAQSLDKAIGCGLHVDEVGTERAGAVEHEHNHCALVFVDDLRVPEGVNSLLGCH